MINLDDFQLYLMREERSENTISCYLRDVQSFFVWYGKEPERVTEFDLIAYKRYLLAKEKTVITSNRKLASVNAFCRYLYDARLLPEAYAAKLTKNRDKCNYKGLSEQDLTALHEAILKKGNPMHICIIELLFGTGIRVSELTGLTLNDIVISDTDSHIRVLGKGMVNRTLPLNATAKQALEQRIITKVQNTTMHRTAFMVRCNWYKVYRA